MIFVTKNEVAWDLSEIFPSTTHPSIQEAIDGLNKTAEQLAKKYKAKIGGLPVKRLADCIKRVEAFQAKLQDVTLFAELSFAANMTLSDTQLIHEKAMKMDANLGKLLAFFELEVGNSVCRNPRMISDAELVNYKHFLQRLERQTPHKLSEVEEQLIIEKDQYGVKAWEELQTKWLNTRNFEITVEGKRKVLPFGQASGLFSHPDRATRESAYKSVYGLLEEHGEIFSSALRNTCNDWMNVCERRKHDSPMHASLIDNDIEEKVINNLLDAVERHSSLYRHYLELKAKMMKLPRLGCHDLIAPLPGSKHVIYTYDKARELIIKAYNRFDLEYASAVKDMFAKNHLDVTPRFGKQNGAFCASWYNGKSAFILGSFNRMLRDVYMLAHELGHATHDYYSESEQTILNLKIPMIVAETASIFGELLLTDLLLSESKSDAEKKLILCSVLDTAGNVIFKVTARTWFEQSLYNSIKQGDYLDFEAICKRWTSARSRIFGNSVEWFSELKGEWTTTPHYYMANFRFYNYPYVYAQLFVYALYQKYREEGSEFVLKFKKALSVGGSISPVEIGKIIGLDVVDPGFWKLGMKQYEHFLEQLVNISN